MLESRKLSIMKELCSRWKQKKNAKNNVLLIVETKTVFNKSKNIFVVTVVPSPAFVRVFKKEIV